MTGVNLGHVVFAQVRQLIANLNKKNFKATSGELSQLLEVYGHDVYVFLFRSLINQLDLKSLKPPSDQTRLQLLAQELAAVTSKPNFVSIICQAFEGVQMTDDFCINLVKSLKLSFAQHLTFGLALAQSHEQTVQQQGIRLLKSKIVEIRGQAGVPSLGSMQPDALSNLLLLMQTNAAFELKDREHLLKAARAANPGEGCDIALVALLYGDQNDSDACMQSNDISRFLPAGASAAAQLADAVQDMGYMATESVEVMSGILCAAGKITEADVSQVLAMMARTHSALAASPMLPVTVGASRDGKQPPLAFDKAADTPALQTWNLSHFVQAVQQLAPDLSWHEAISTLDSPSFDVRDAAGVQLLLDTHKLASPAGESFPVEAFLGHWRNATAQLALLRACITGPDHHRNLFLASPRRVSPDSGQPDSPLWGSIDLVEALIRLSDSQGLAAVAPLLDAPREQCPELFALALVQCDASWGPLWGVTLAALLQHFMSSRNMGILERLWNLNSSAIVCGLATLRQSPQGGSAWIAHIFEAVQALDILLKVLSMHEDRMFSLELAVYAAQQNALPFASWVNKAASQGGERFADAAVAFLQKRVLEHGASEQQLPAECCKALIQAMEGASLQPATQAQVRALAQRLPDSSATRSGPAVAAHSRLPPEDMPMELSRIPDQAPMTEGGSEAVAAPAPLPGQQQQFAPDVEEEANSYFQRIYTDEIHIEGVIAMLKAFKGSAKPREQEIFTCMIHNLFDEYRFFPKYPERELLITGQLFGSLIQHQLVLSITLGIALRYVLEALRKPQQSNMFKFGMSAIEAFKPRLAEWPQYCHHVLQIAHLQQTQPGLIAHIRSALASGGTSPGAVGAGQSPSGMPATQETGPGEGQTMAQMTYSTFEGQTEQTGSPVSAVREAGNKQYAGFSQGYGQDPHHQLPTGLQGMASDQTRAGEPDVAVKVDLQSSAAQQTLSAISGASALQSANGADLLMQNAQQVPQPDSKIMDQVSFIFNNLTTTMIDAKEKELSAVLPERFYPWLCQYMVIKRAAQEQNYLSLYMHLAERLDKRVKHFIRDVVRFTIENVKLLIADEKITSSSSLRSILKNLASWLGMLTLQRNRPILQRDLDMKQLIIDAFEQGRLIAAIPFVAKVLECSVNSRIFRLPNPWTSLMLSLLAEIHPMQRLKLNIKFEVEMLCKTLGTDIKLVSPSSCLRGRTARKDGNSDWSSGSSDAGLGALKLPAVPDGRLLAAAASLSAAGGMGPTVMQPTVSLREESVPVLPPGAAQAQVQELERQLALNVSSQFVLNPQIPLLQSKQQLSGAILQAVTQAIKDIFSPVVERSVTIACITTRELVLKDFALDQDPAGAQLRSAATMMVQNLAGSLALVTCREPLRHSMVQQLRSALGKASVDAAAVEQAAQVLAADNLELGCSLIEQAASDKARTDMEGALEDALLQRATPGTPLQDAQAQTQAWARSFPQALRPAAGPLAPQQRHLYEDFTRLSRDPLSQIVGDQPVRPIAGDAAGASLGVPNSSVSCPPPPPPAQQLPPLPEHVKQALDKCSGFLTKAEDLVLRSSALASSSLSSLPQGHELVQLRMQTFQHLQKSLSREEVALGYARRLLRRLHDRSSFGSCKLGRDWLLSSLSTILEVVPRLAKELAAWVAQGDDSLRFNRQLTIALVQARLLNLNAPEYSVPMLRAINGGRGHVAVDHVIAVLQCCLFEIRAVSTADCFRLLDGLAKLQQAQPKPADALVRLLEDARSLARGGYPQQQQQQQQQSLQQQHPSGMQGDGGRGVEQRVPLAHMLQGGRKGKDGPDPAGLRDMIAATLDQWFSHIQAGDDRAIMQAMTVLLQQGWLKGDDSTDRFLRLAVSVCLDRCLHAAEAPVAALDYVQVDLLAQFLAALVRSFEEWSRSTAMSKLGLVNKVLAAVAKVMHAHQVDRRAAFNQKPFHRLILHLLDLHEVVGDPLVLSMADFLHAVQPRILPGFSFSWLEVVSHRKLMPKLLQTRGKGWGPFQRLLVGFFRHLEPYLRAAQLPDPVKLLYKGTLRVLLVLLHDFPEFLCEYHASFCDVIPPSCIQLRNVILSAFPRNMLLPDPSSVDLKAEPLPEAAKPPAMLSTYAAALEKRPVFKAELDSYLRGRPNAVFLADLPSHLFLSAPADIAAAGTRVNVPLINALVLHVASAAIAHNPRPGKPLSAGGVSLDLFVKLSRDLETEARYLFLNALANQLRFPNAHTYFFSSTILALFQAVHDKEIVREQITRVLIERLIVYRPHPWGLLVTFIELIKNPAYDLSRHEFVRSAPEIEQLFSTVAQFCLKGSEATSAPANSDA